MYDFKSWLSNSMHDSVSHSESFYASFLWAKNPKFSYMVRQGGGGEGGGGGVVNQSCLCN